jgi:PAS domain S-box-containing protein
VCVELILLTFLAPCLLAVNPKRIIILNPGGTDVEPYCSLDSAFRITLKNALASSVDIYDIPLNLARFSGSEGERPLVEFLEALSKDQPVDLIVPLGVPGLQFLVRHRDRLFPDAPVLALGLEPRFVPPGFLQTNATFVTQRVDLVGIIEDILQMQPQTTEIAVVFGSSPTENRWAEECRREYQPFTNRVKFTYLNGLSLQKILERCAALPPQSFIVFHMFLLDSEGVHFEQSDPLKRLHEIANAPLFAYFASEFGVGPIGGRLYQNSYVGEQGALTAVRILRGERAGNIPPRVFEAATPVFDWRELKRWGISEARLPAGSVIRFREPNLWEMYRWQITGIILLMLLQTASILGLLVNRTKRLREEAEATLIAEISSRFVNLPPDDVEREITDAEHRICKLLDLDFSSFWQWSDEDGCMVLTHFYRVHEGPNPIGLKGKEAFPWVDRRMRAGRLLAISTLEELPPEAARDCEVARQLGVMSTLSLPLSVGGEPPIGVLSLSTARAIRTWPEPLIKRLQLVGQIFANALARKNTDQALRESENRFRLLIEQAPEAILVWDVGEGRLVLANAQAEQLFGYNRQELFEFGIQRLFAPVLFDGPLVEGGASILIERSLSGETVVFERTIRSAHGQQTDCEVRLTRLPSKGKKLIRASYIDITARNQAEVALHELNGQLIRAHEEERSWIARELHDDITQRIALLAIQMSYSPSSVDGTSAAERMSSIRADLVQLSRDIHALSYRLHPSMLEDLGFAAAVKAECERFSRQVSASIITDLQELPEPIPYETTICLFRVAQESIHNAIHYANASRIDVSLRTADGGLRFSVRDNGVGFDSTTLQNKNTLGLASMRERMSLIGGELKIESTPGKGTSILAWAPLQKG